MKVSELLKTGPHISEPHKRVLTVSRSILAFSIDLGLAQSSWLVPAKRDGHLAIPHFDKFLQILAQQTFLEVVPHLSCMIERETPVRGLSTVSKTNEILAISGQIFFAVIRIGWSTRWYLGNIQGLLLLRLFLAADIFRIY